MPTTKVHRARGSRAAVYGIIACTLAVDIFAIRSTDPDFFFPDPFKYLILFLLVAFVLVDLVRAPRVRVALFSVLFAIPAVSLLLEWRTAARDARTGHLMVEKSSDPVLRFNYRPGFDTNEKSPSGGELKITSDWLWDVPHAVTKPKGTYRVMVLGDSVPNDPTIPFMSRYPKRLEAKLRKRFPGTPIQVMNVSCEGYNTVQEVELLEDVGLKYHPDLVVLSYVLNDPFLQNGAYRRIGNSYFLFRLQALASVASAGSYCPAFQTFQKGYAFDLIVHNSLTRLRLLADLHKFDVIVATLPIVERFDDPVCLGLYDRVLSIAKAQRFDTVRLVDAFRGKNYRDYLKPSDSHDITHPNKAGHEIMVTALAKVVAPHIAAFAQKSE